MRTKIAAAWVLLQVVFFAVWAAREESRLHTGDSILVETIPVDPRDLLRGQYLELGYRFNRWSSLATSKPPPEGSLVWVVLEAGDEFHAPVAVRRDRPRDLRPGQVAIRGVVQEGNIRFGIERYFVPEGSDTPDPRDITVRLSVGKDGRPRIAEVYVKGEPWP